MPVRPSDLVLVCLMPKPRDLEIARLLGWYRIPLRSAPKVVAVDFLAFYQTSMFAQGKWRIEFIAPVRGHELTTRGELLQDERDHPYASLEYFKLQIGPLVRLPTPILANKWRRITFFYTTGEYLLQAHTIDDLIVTSEERPILWQALRERASQEEIYSGEMMPGEDIDATLLASLLGLIESQGNG